MALRKKILSVLLLSIILILCVLINSGCKDNRTPGQKAYDFVQVFDRRSHLKFRGGRYEYDEGKKDIAFSGTSTRDDKLKGYLLSLEHFRKSKTFFENAKVNALGIESLDEYSKAAVQDIIKASETYLEAVNIYLITIGKAYEDENYDFNTAIKDTYPLQYRAEKNIMQVHEAIKNFESKYPEVFNGEWVKMLDGLIAEQKSRLEGLSLEYGINNQ